MSTELQPCPFCGGAARIESNRDWHRLFCAHDDDCVLDADDHDLMYPAQPGYLKEIAEVWNRRASPAAAVPEGALPPKMSWLDAPHDIPNDQASAWSKGWNACRAAVEADRARQTALPTPFCKVGTGPHGLWAERGADGGEPVYTASQVQAILADRAQQGEPVACPVCAEGVLVKQVSHYCTACGTAVASPADIKANLAATKAAAPADASSQQQDMSVRVAPAPAGQHDAGGAVLTDERIIELWHDAGCKVSVDTREMKFEFARAIEAELTSRAQRTAIDKLNSAAPVSSTATAGAVEGWKWAPAELTETMLDAALRFEAEGGGIQELDEAWKAILAAAPQPPEAKAGEKNHG